MIWSRRSFAWGMLVLGIVGFGLQMTAFWRPDGTAAGQTPPVTERVDSDAEPAPGVPGTSPAGSRPAITKEADTPKPPSRRLNGYASVKLADIPHVRQKPDFCGEACAAMYLAKLGHVIDQDDVFDQAGLAPEEGRGCYTRELARALTRIGFQVGNVWYEAAAAHADKQLEDRFRELHADLLTGVPSIICMHYDESPDSTEHFRLIVGYDDRTDEILYHEPAVDRGAYRRMSSESLLKRWPLKYEEDRWTVIRLRLVPGSIRNVHSTDKYTDADYAQQVIRAKRKMPEGSSFTVVIERPFVVMGDEGPDEVRRWAQGTIRWAINRLKASYFTKDPNEILDIWLFKDKESYNKHVLAIFGDVPHTPFGYYSQRDKALIMNIDTGGGTLVHEIVHPFIASNFPDCPAWFNEGLASLYEQCGDYRGRIWGYTNWRLAGLQEAIQPPKEEDDDAETPAETARNGNRKRDLQAGDETTEPAARPEPAAPPRPELPTFKSLCSTTTYEFYAEDPGTNYAQARYLCYYLQQRGLLRKYYQQFRENVDDDRGGYETLKAVLGIESEADMAKFLETWKAWVMTLRYP